MGRPPYHRWAVAVLVVVAAVAFDLRGGRGEVRPFTVRPVPAGAELTDDDLEWREVPRGLLPPAVLDGATARVDLPAGTPIVPALLAASDPTPPEWWSVPVSLTPGIPVGARVRLVLLDDGAGVEGLVTSGPVDDLFGGTGIGLVAVPPEHADAVAAASAEGRLVVLVAEGPVRRVSAEGR
ncbi:MAG TPA: hypothetical protein ENK55_00355 [Actinobacteria bacterium]|nr:hypothetical protein [Actinomycetota bacterium]